MKAASRKPEKRLRLVYKKDASQIEDSVTALERLQTEELQQRTIKLSIGDRVTWPNAPAWWNPSGEKIREIQGDLAWIDYRSNAFRLEDLILVEEKE